MVTVGTSLADPVQWRVEDGGNGHWYEIRDNGGAALTWASAHSMAESLTYSGYDGHLASITSAAENKFVLDNLLDDDLHRAILIGAARVSGGTAWQWTDGGDWGYTNWNPGEPQLPKSTDACLAIFSNGALNGTGFLGGWHDVDLFAAYSDYGYLIEYGPPATGPVQWREEDGGNGHWYEIHSSIGVGLSWEIANASAESLGGHLASITSADENQFILANLLDDDPHTALFIGAVRANTASPWQWTDGEEWGFTYWDPGEPKNNTEDTRIVIFSNYALKIPSGADKLGGWNDLGVSGLYYFRGYIVEYTDREGPIASDVVISPNPVEAGTSAALVAMIDDTTTGESDIFSAEYSLDGGTTWAPMAPLDSSYDSPIEAVSASIDASDTPGVYELLVRGTDSAGNVGAEQPSFLVVYDPDGGFVTGGGWIDSEPGAYRPDATLEGKANFGFVSKYKKGASVPTGNTEFQFKAGGLNFHSTSYDWLVVNQNGSNAQFKGVGTINGLPNFKFMLWAGDGDPDTFRIKIWWEDDAEVEHVIYDNNMEQPIGAGSIVVHTK